MDTFPFGESGVLSHTIFIDHLDMVLRDRQFREQLLGCCGMSTGSA